MSNTNFPNYTRSKFKPYKQQENYIIHNFNRGRRYSIEHFVVSHQP